MSTVELLAPAGNPEALNAAIGEGADAVYLGLRSFNARLRSANFAFNQFEATVEVCRKNAKKVYVTVNTVFEQREADRMWQLLQYLERVGPDGIIVQDFGVVKMAREHFPKLPLHASTQMNVASAKGVNFLSRLGFKRAVLARELSLDEIRSVRAATNLELEVFVHGALCVSASGLCLFSSYLGGKSANRGVCAQACRRLYATDAESGYFFSPDDLQLIGYVPELMDAGVESFKIEGRMKSAEYVGSVVAAYRHMIDNWKLDRERALAKSLAILQSDFARPKTTFYFAGRVEPSFLHPEQGGGTGIPLGKVRDIRVLDEGRYALLDAHDGLAEGDSVRIHRSDDSGRLTGKVREVKAVPAGMLVRIDAEFRQSDQVYLVQTASTGRRYAPVLPKDIGRYHKFPTRELAPRPEHPAMSKADLGALSDGLYALVSRVSDIFLLNAFRPAKAMILFDRKNALALRKHEKELPFKRDTLVFWLDPYFPEGDATWLVPELEYWVSRGQRIFVANNPAHLGLLRTLAGTIGSAGSGAAAREGAGEKAGASGSGGDFDDARSAKRRPAPAKNDELTIISGPWLYAFNRWAAAFFFQEGARFIVPPLEISKQDFQKLSETVPSASWMPVVFAYPALFRIRADLGPKYDFRYFTDRDGESYELVTGEDYSVVIPSRPFSMVDRIPFLRKEGVGKFILDFSHVELTKQLYRQVMKAAEEGKVLPDTTRFNWKNGFWQPEENAAGD
ncbi:MAG TPA: peptidase U32 family protein [Rectinemataceae bacterium]|nr:peptidase U32 family protein [Rectinemataceae bacterium]